MPALVNYSGGEGFGHGSKRYAVDTSLSLAIGSHVVDSYYPPCKRSRVVGASPFVWFMQPELAPPSIEVLPDECLYEIFRRLPGGGEERGNCACVSKKWLYLLSSIRRDEVCVSEEKMDEDLDIESDGYLTRCLEGKKATDVRLAAIAVGTGSRGGLGKLMIRGNNGRRGVTNFGLAAIGRGAASLRVLSLWNVSSISDQGLIEIAKGCPKLEKVDISECPFISDRGLIAIAANCPNLKSLVLDGCANIGNEGLKAVAHRCSKLELVSIKDCPLVGNEGVSSIMNATMNTLKKVTLQSVDITDDALAVIGYSGRSVTDLVLTGLQKVSEKGFWVMGKTTGLQSVKSITITSCRGVTDLALEAIGNGCPKLKQLTLRKCSFVSDRGMVAFAQTGTPIESLILEECNRITQSGVLGALSCFGGNLKALSLVKCMGIRDIVSSLAQLVPCRSLRSLTIRDCPGFGNVSMALVGKLCPQLQCVDVSGLSGVTDAGFLPLIENSEAGLVKVNLSGCVGMSDAAVSLMVRLHGETLKLLNLDGCRKITDATLFAIAENCKVLHDLDVSKCAITDQGVAALARGKHLGLKVLSMAGCSQVTNRSLSCLASMIDTLEGLNLQHCNSISKDTIGELGGIMFKCDILL